MVFTGYLNIDDISINKKMICISIILKYYVEESNYLLK